MRALLRLQTMRTERVLRAHDAAQRALRAATQAPEPKVKRMRTARGDNLPWFLRPQPALFPEPVTTYTAGATGAARRVVIGTAELHALLAAAVPPHPEQRVRRAHVRVRDAMRRFAAQLAALSGTPTSDSIEAAQLLATALDQWIDTARRARAEQEAKEATWRARCRAFARAQAGKAAAPVSRSPLMGRISTAVHASHPPAGDVAGATDAAVAPAPRPAA